MFYTKFNSSSTYGVGVTWELMCVNGIFMITVHNYKPALDK